MANKIAVFVTLVDGIVGFQARTLHAQFFTIFGNLIIVTILQGPVPSDLDQAILVLTTTTTTDKLTALPTSEQPKL